LAAAPDDAAARSAASLSEMQQQLALRLEKLRISGVAVAPRRARPGGHSPAAVVTPAAAQCLGAMARCTAGRSSMRCK
jgi:hypothetical protein